MQSHLFDKLLTKKMTRKEFLVYLGMCVFALSGVAGMLKALAEPQLRIKDDGSSPGFGGGPYGK